MTSALILLAAGQSRRFCDASAESASAKLSNLKKTWMLLRGEPLWLQAAKPFFSCDEITQRVVVVAEEDIEFFRAQFSGEIAKWNLEIVAGGAERYHSVENALRALRTEITLVAIHDAARPCITTRDVEAVLQVAKKTGAAILGAPVVNTLKKALPSQKENSAKINCACVAETIPRDNLWEIFTPQVFTRELICEAYKKRENFAATDDSALVERLGHQVALVTSPRTNIKVTTPEDLILAESIFDGLEKSGL